MLLLPAVYGGGEKVVNIPTPHTVELPPCVMTCDLVHYYLNEPVGDKHGEEFLVSTEHCHTSHLVYSPLTYFRRKYLVTPFLLVQIRLNLPVQLALHHHHPGQ